MAINFVCACGASEYAADVANKNFKEISERLAALEANVTPHVYTNETRPDADDVPEGTMIFNIDDSAPNWSARIRDEMGAITGALWVDSSGNMT